MKIHLRPAIFFLLLWVIPVAGQQLTSLPDAPQPQVTVAELKKLFFSKLGAQATAIQMLIRPGEPAELLEGMHAKLSLVGEVSSKLPTGTSFQARLDEPVAIQGQTLLPNGTVFEGHLETRRARPMMRPGSMFMTFDRVILPDGNVEPIELHLVSTESTAVKSDAEGMLHPAMSKRRLAIQAGGTALSAKFADDLAELAGGTAVSAGTARLVGAGAAATFLVLQKGREVKLQPGDKFEVEFGRAAVPMAFPGNNRGEK